MSPLSYEKYPAHNPVYHGVRISVWMQASLAGAVANAGSQTIVCQFSRSASQQL
jgi:hypothetical protein